MPKNKKYGAGGHFFLSVLIFFKLEFVGYEYTRMVCSSFLSQGLRSKKIFLRGGHNPLHQRFILCVTMAINYLFFAR